jgi:hypothetical protein
MKLPSAFIGLLLLVVLAACDTGQPPNPVTTSVSISNPTTAANTQPTSVPIASNTPGGNQVMTSTPHVTGLGSRTPKTSPVFTFMPRRGGPGTIVRITGGNFTPGKMVVIRIGVPQPIGEPLASVQVGDDTRWNTSITLPSTDPSGKPITSTDLQIVAMDENNQVIVSEPFVFVPPK